MYQIRCIKKDGSYEELAHLDHSLHESFLHANSYLTSASCTALLLMDHTTNSVKAAICPDVFSQYLVFTVGGQVYRRPGYGTMSELIEPWFISEISPETCSCTMTLGADPHITETISLYKICPSRAQ